MQPNQHGVLIQSAIRKADGELQIVWGEVYIPGVPDSENDFMTTDEVRQMAHRFIKSGRLHSIDVQHDNNVVKAHIVESFVARDDDPLFIPGSWVVGVHVEDPGVWLAIKSGKLNGFSMEAMAVRVQDELDMTLPDEVSGCTNEVGGHSHRFRAFFDDEGNFVKGETDYVDGHRHSIVRGTLTEEAQGHSHTFCIVDAMIEDAA